MMIMMVKMITDSTVVMMMIMVMVPDTGEIERTLGRYGVLPCEQCASHEEHAVGSVDSSALTSASTIFMGFPHK